MPNLNELLSKKSKELPKGTPALGAERATELLKLLPDWALNAAGAIEKTYKFKDFHQTMAFVNKVADIANDENHHPDLAVSYNKCTVQFSTHSVGGLSENDFISAAKVERSFSAAS